MVRPWMPIFSIGYPQDHTEFGGLAKPGFDAIVVNRTSITTTSTSLSGLKRNTNYYWRVRASNGTSSSAWSAARSFKTVR